ncbi:MAG TPA: MBL fold metallo-hydrolase [bacterium]|nr:MBL fold metallo-hydrolase [bacterium]
MLSGSKLKYFGWSSFAIESPSGNLLFDPLCRPMYGARWSDIHDFSKAKVICVTHGHFDHYVDVPPVLKETEAVVVASQEICSHLNSRYKVKKERLFPIKPFQEVCISGYKITAFEWQHREFNFSKMIRADLAASFRFIYRHLFKASCEQLRENLFSSFNFAWLNLLQAPFHAPYFGFYVEGPDNIRLMNYCEGFSAKMKIEETRELGRRFRPEIVLAGMQLDFEKELSEGVAALSPKTVVLFPPHEAIFEKVGLKSSPPQKFVEEVKRKSPEADIIVAKPQCSFDIP